MAKGISDVTGNRRASIDTSETLYTTLQTDSNTAITIARCMFIDVVERHWQNNITMHAYTQ